MNNRMQDKMAMYMAVQATCQRNLHVLRALPAFADGHKRLVKHLGFIHELAQSQAMDTSGLAADKARLRAAMAEAVVWVARAVRAFAVSAGNSDLAAQVNVTAGSMLRGRDLAAISIARGVHAVAQGHLALLDGHGITAEKLLELGGAIDAYAAVVSKPRQAAMEAVTVNRRLAAEFASVDAILGDLMDCLVGQFKSKAPLFVEEYQRARVIVNTRASKPKAAPQAGDGAVAVS